MPQLCARPGASETNRRSLPTSVGVDERASAPTPSCPRSLPPQQYARPSALIMQVCRPPATMLTRGRDDGGGPIASATEIEDGTAAGGACTGAGRGELFGAETAAVGADVV